MRIAELPFRERPVLELLNLHHGHATPDRDYAGYGWARVGELWLATADAPGQRVEDVLVLALHSADDGEPLPDDIDLEFELPGRNPAVVLASLFLEHWLPALPAASAIVLSLCNPYRATLRRPATSALPIHYARGDVESWLEREPDRIRLVADSWSTLAP